MFQKTVILFSIGFFQFFFASAQCQLCYLDFEKTKETVNALKAQKEVILFSGCEYNDIGRRLKIDSVYFLPVKNSPQQYEIYIKGRIIAFFSIQDQGISNYTAELIDFHEGVDIAYIHIRTGGFLDQTLNKYIFDATCLGIYLNYECDPCTDPFDYPEF